MKSRKLLVIFCFLLPILKAYADSSNTEVNTKKSNPSQQVYFSTADEHGFPKKEHQTSFSCTDKVYSVIELSDYPAGKYQLSVQWFDPHDTLREHTQYDFSVRNSFTRIWTWLSLSRGTGAGILKLITPSAGFDDFIGKWKIRTKVNNKLISERQIEINC